MKIRLTNGVTIEGKEGVNLWTMLVEAGYILSAPCGGRGLCGKCRVRIVEGYVQEPPAEDGMVCACRVVPVSDLAVELPPDEIIMGNEVASVNSGGIEIKTVKDAGIALDIGTTTVSAQLVDLSRGSILDSCSFLNDQRFYGADVMSRIESARQGKTSELYKLINRQTLKILERFTIKNIKTLAVCGNTTMLHFFVNADPSGMGRLPFTPVFLEEKNIPGKDLALPVEQVTIMPSVSAFFGSDIVAGLAVLDILNSPAPVILLDIGTNGEIGLFHKGRLFCCSTAAGPAFEGAEISCGIGGVGGAINRVALTESGLSFQTIGNIPPAGICGAGLIDAVALMLKQGIIDETGAFCCKTNKKFVITGGVSITDRDIRQYQLAKSAIQSGIRILCRRAGISLADLDRAFIAGGGGFFIDIQNAIDSGVLPGELGGKIKVCGNTSLQGAVRSLLDAGFTGQCKKIVEKCEIVDLAADPLFMDVFTENMGFPEIMTPKDLSGKFEEVLADSVCQTAVIDTAALGFSQDVRKACEINTCGKFNKCWTCPPAIGSLEVLMEKIRAYEKAFVFTTKFDLEDSFDYEGMVKAQEIHNGLTRKMHEQFGKENPVYGVGSCTICKTCAYPEPCRFKEKTFPSIEAAGINITELSKAAGIRYNNGKNTVTYFSMLLFNRIGAVPQTG